MSRAAVSFLLALFLSAFLFVGAGVSGANEAKVILVKGEPAIMKKESSDWNPCKKGAAIDNGDRIKTSKGEVVEISFSEDTVRVIRIREDSDVFIVKRESPYSIELVDGEVLTFLKKLPKGSTFEIKTPAGTCGARGTGWSVTVDELKAIYRSFENAIYVQGLDASGNAIGGELTVRDGWQVIVDKFEKPGELERIAAGDLDKWNEWKSDLLDRLEGLKERGFEAAGAMQNKIQALEERKVGDIRDTRDSDTIDKREETGTSGGSGGGYRLEKT